MGIPHLWEMLKDGEVVDIAIFAARHFEEHKRPLRIAVDEASWRYLFFLKPEKVVEIRKKCPPANPSEKNILRRVLQLLRLNIQLIFVFDGNDKPKKRDRYPRGPGEAEVRLLKETLTHLAIPCHTAPAEAEAECVKLARLGIVDAVWTEDSDALMFGADVVIRFLSTPTGNKDIDKVRIYKSKDILAKFPMLDRKGLVLFAVLSGGDYEQTGLRGCGPERVLHAARLGFGKSLCEADVGLDVNRFRAWREQLTVHFQGHLEVPIDFPNPQHIKDYNRPKVSAEYILRQLPQAWEKPLDEKTLFLFLGHKFNFWVKQYIESIIPIQLMRTLAQTEPGQHASNVVYDIRWIKKVDSVQSKITYLLSSLTFRDLVSWKSDLGVLGSDRDTYDPPLHVECAKFLDCIIRHGSPSAMADLQPTPQPDGTKRRGRPPKNPTSEISTPRSLSSIPINTTSTNNTPQRTPKASTGKKRQRETPTSGTQSDHSSKKANSSPFAGLPGVIDLTSDGEDEILGLISPNTGLREARRRKFGATVNESSLRKSLSSTAAVNAKATKFFVPPPVEDWDLPGF